MKYDKFGVHIPYVSNGSYERIYINAYVSNGSYERIYGSFSFFLDMKGFILMHVPFCSYALLFNTGLKTSLSLSLSVKAHNYINCNLYVKCT